MIDLCVSTKHEDGSRRNGNRRREREIVNGSTVGIDGSMITDQQRIHPVIVGITVQEFSPATMAWKAQLIVEEGRVIETHHDDDIATLSLDPSMERHDPVGVLHVKDMKALARKAGSCQRKRMKSCVKRN